MPPSFRPSPLHAIAAPRSTLPPEEALLLICARREIPESLRQEARALTQRVDWERLVDLARQHRVGSMVYASLKRDFPEAIPAQPLARLREDVLAGTHGNLRLLRELLQLARLLGTHGIRYAVFKGLVINQMVYQDLGIRKCGDIDILVGRGDFLRAKALLQAEGFSQTLSDKAEVQYLQSGLWHEQRQVSIDLHWGLPPRELGIRADRILMRAADITIGGQSLPAFGPEDLLIVLCVNATKEYWNQLLYPYCDIHEFLRSHPGLDWPALFRRARELRCARMVGTALRVMTSLYEAPLPARGETGIPVDERAAKELLRQLFELPPDDSGHAGHSRMLHFFDSTDDYFLGLIDTPLQRLAYRLVHIPLRRHVPEAMGLDLAAPPLGLGWLGPIAKAARIGGAILRKAYRRLKRCVAGPSAKVD